jgi:hypothetical protein
VGASVVVVVLLLLLLLLVVVVASAVVNYMQNCARSVYCVSCCAGSVYHTKHVVCLVSCAFSCTVLVPAAAAVVPCHRAAPSSVHSVSTL